MVYLIHQKLEPTKIKRLKVGMVKLQNTPIIFFHFEGHRGNSLFHFAAQNGRLDLLKYIISMGKIDINIRNDFSETALHLAAGCYNKGIRITGSA